MHEHRIVYEEVPGSRTTQETVIDPQRERIAYEELRPGTEVQPGDQYRNTQGRWVEYTMDTSGVPIVGPTAMARRPYRVNAIIIDALADAHAATAQLQNERDEARAAIAQVKAEFNSQADVLAEVREALAAEQRAHKCTMTSGLQACKEREEALAEVAKLSTELWARKPLEDRIASLTYELANAREEIQKLVKTIAENADQFAEHTKGLVCERDEARAERDRLQGLIDDLLDEPTAKQVQDMLRTWATELDWLAGCFDSVAREQIDTIQKTLIAVMERIDTLNPEGGSDGE